MVKKLQLPDERADSVHSSVSVAAGDVTGIAIGRAQAQHAALKQREAVVFYLSVMILLVRLTDADHVLAEPGTNR